MIEVGAACLAGARVALDGHVAALEHLGDGSVLHLRRLTYPHLVQARLQGNPMNSLQNTSSGITLQGYGNPDRFGCPRSLTSSLSSTPRVRNACSGVRPEVLAWLESTRLSSSCASASEGASVSTAGPAAPDSAKEQPHSSRLSWNSHLPLSN